MHLSPSNILEKQNVIFSELKVVISMSFVINFYVVKTCLVYLVIMLIIGRKMDDINFHTEMTRSFNEESMQLEMIFT